MGRSQAKFTNAQWEGAEAAKQNSGRGTNPYPLSDIVSRNEWFAGFDLTIERLANEARKPHKH